jgi:hypothetical protein
MSPPLPLPLLLPVREPLPLDRLPLDRPANFIAPPKLTIVPVPTARTTQHD